MTNNSRFFESPQAAAKYKHQLLKSYIPAWAGKVGSRSSGKRVVVYDAYSGPGRYDDQQPGSAELVVDTAAAMAAIRRVYSVFTDKERSYVDRLTVLLQEKGIDPATYEVRLGPVDTHIGNVLALASEDPLFVFLDPFGLTVPFETLVQILKSRDKRGFSRLLQPKTEVLMNFSYEAVRRIAGVLQSEKDYPAKAGQISALNSALGGEWWQEIVRSGAVDWVGQVLSGFANRVGASAGYEHITAEVADSLHVKPVYELVLFTRHPDGLWEMATAMSYARRDWRAHLRSQLETELGGQMELGPLNFKDNEDEWVCEIAANIQALLAEVSTFTVETNLGKVLGRTLGLAREMHLRKALKSLEGRGIVAPCSKGDLQRAVVTRA